MPPAPPQIGEPGVTNLERNPGDLEKPRGARANRQSVRTAYRWHTSFYPIAVYTTTNHLHSQHKFRPLEAPEKLKAPNPFKLRPSSCSLWMLRVLWPPSLHRTSASFCCVVNPPKLHPAPPPAAARGHVDHWAQLVTFTVQKRSELWMLPFPLPASPLSADKSLQI